ncbi:MAG: RNB domain-containing ribonuclease, partial [Deltaproteobacteria bacterium]|nr:RNB domain-containing ribonuclease [Deltaproteobacteria bacterium]
ELLQDGLYLAGTLESPIVRSREEYEQETKNRRAKAAEKESWNAFIERVRQGKVIAADDQRLKDLLDFALGRTPKSRILKELNIQATPERAHTLLLKLQHWDYSVNPHIQRLGFSTNISYPPLEEPAQDERLDLTHLPAFAIDDEGNQDPDDAVSIEGRKLWIHIADVASVVKPDSAADIHARAQAANL